MWFMKPGLRKPVSISPRQRLSGEAANGDIASAQFADNYDPTLAGEDTVDGRAVYKVRLVAKRKDVTYDQAIFYLDKENHLALKAEYLTTSGTPFKYSVMKYGNKTPGSNAPFISELKIIDSKYANQHSTLVYADLKSANHPDSLFNLANLGR
jgi:putative ABC transport system permease protein